MATFKAFAVFLLLFLTICPFTLAIDAQNERKWLTMEPMKSTPYTFELKNNNPNATTYSLFVKGNFVWIIFPNSQITLDPGESKTITLIGFPDTNTPPQVYPAQIVAMSELETLTYNVAMDIPALNKPVETRHEIRSVSLDEQGIKFMAYSQEPINLTIEIDKDNQPVESLSAVLEAGEATFERKINFEPGNYTAKIIATKGNKIIYSDKKSYEKSFESGMVVTESTIDSILWSATTVTITNNGNAAEYKNYDLEADPFIEPFLSSSEQFDKISLDNGNIINRWSFLVAGSSQREFIYTYNYSYAFAISFVVVLCIAAIVIVIRKKVVVKKTLMGSAKGIKSDHELRIILEVSNRTGRSIKDITLEDYLQPLFKIKKAFVGPAPTGFYRKGDDIKIVWKIPEIAPKESRVLTYTIVPKVGLGGSYSFSQAKLNYRIGNFKRIVFSNILKLGK